VSGRQRAASSQDRGFLASGPTTQVGPMVWREKINLGVTGHRAGHESGGVVDLASRVVEENGTAPWCPGFVAELEAGQPHTSGGRRVPAQCYRWV
jgi:hypothetical protein